MRPWDVISKPQVSTRPAFTHVSLFAGCGGFDLGLQAAGFETIWANDFNADACATYRHNLGPTITEGDITQIAPDPALVPDLLTAGFPCQPFSNAGLRKGTDDERGQLYLTALLYVERLKPRCVVMENVRGLASSIVMLDGRTQPLLQAICADLAALGYHVAVRLMDASYHHVPQRRIRLFIVGMRADGPAPFVFPASKPPDDTLSLGNTILDLEPSAPNQNELMPVYAQAATLLTHIPEGGSWNDIPDEALPERLKRIRANPAKYHSPKFYRRIHRREIATTITASFKPEKAAVWHPTEQRVLSVREVARIQAFPDWFIFMGRTVESKYKQIGNAVSPRLAYELGLAIKDQLMGRPIIADPAALSWATFSLSKKALPTNTTILFSLAPLQLQFLMSMETNNDG